MRLFSIKVLNCIFFDSLLDASDAKDEGNMKQEEVQIEEPDKGQEKINVTLNKLNELQTALLPHFDNKF